MKSIKKESSNLSLYASIAVLTILFSLFRLNFRGSNQGAVSCPFELPSASKIYVENRITLSKHLPKGTSVQFLMASSPRPIRSDSDTDYPNYRQSSNIMYMMGEINISPALIHVNWNGSSLNLTLFVPLLTQRERIFEGDILEKADLKAHYDLDTVADMSDFLLWVKHNSSVNMISPLSDIYAALGSDLLEELEAKSVDFKFRKDLLESFYQSRFLKSRKEIEMISFATKVAKWAHNCLAKDYYNINKVSEMDLLSSFTYYTSICGGRLQAYSPIVGFGVDSATLHFRTGENSSRGYTTFSSKDEQFVLIDASPEYHGYASDITRTLYPLNSPRHSLIYKMVQKAQQAAILSFSQGTTWQTVEQEASISLTQSLQDHYFLYKNYSLSELLSQNAYKAFMPHGLGHPVGLDVHDPIPHLTNQSSYTLENGIVHTIEPGIYFISFYLKSLERNISSIGRFVNWTTVMQYMDIGGVRIEDVLTLMNGKRVVL